MSNTIAYVDNQTLTNIADAVRYKTGTNERMLLNDIPDKIRNLDTSDITALDTRVTAVEGDVDETNERLGELKSAIGEIDLTELFVLEDLTISTSGWTYNLGYQRVGTKEGVTLPLKSGDVIGLTDYTNARFYVGWKTGNTYKIDGWKTSDYTITEDGDYVFTIANRTDVDQTSKYALASLFYGYRPIIFDAIRENSSDILDVDNVVLEFNSGRIATDGEISPAGETELEVYTQKIPCISGQKFYLHLSHSTVRNMWFCYALFDENGNIITRTAIIKAINGIEKYTVISIPNGNAKYIAFTFRSYNDYIFNVHTNVGSVLYSAISLNKQFQDAMTNSNANDFVKNINHRGYNIAAPENTLPAFKLSKKVGFKYVETDIRFTADNVAVLLHDTTIDRTSNGSGSIADMTYETALTYDFGSWFSSKYAGTKIPTFEQFISLCRNLGLHPYIEISVGTESQIQGLVDTVKSYGMEKNVTWISYYDYLLEYVIARNSSARIGYLVDSITEAVITRATSLKNTSNEVFIDAQYRTLTSAAVTLCVNANLPLEVWTINSPEDMVNANDYVSGFTSDSKVAGYEIYVNAMKN